MNLYEYLKIIELLKAIIQNAQDEQTAAQAQRVLELIQKQEVTA